MTAIGTDLGLCFLTYVAAYFVLTRSGVRAFLERRFPMPDVRCPHCDKEVLSPYDAIRYSGGWSWAIGRKKWCYFQCPLCGKWSHASSGTLFVVLFALFLLALVAFAIIPALWMRAILYGVTDLGLCFLHIRSTSMTEDADL